MQFQEVCVSVCTTVTIRFQVYRNPTWYIKAEWKTNVSDTLMTDDSDITFPKH